jgi:hypothetical protein
MRDVMNSMVNLVRSVVNGMTDLVRRMANRVTMRVPVRPTHALAMTMTRADCTCTCAMVHPAMVRHCMMRHRLGTGIGGGHRGDCLIALHRRIRGSVGSGSGSLGERGTGKRRQGEGEQQRTNVHGETPWGRWICGRMSMLQTCVQRCALGMRPQLAET